MEIGRSYSSKTARRALDRGPMTSSWHYPGLWFERVIKHLTSPETRNIRIVCKGWLFAAHSNLNLLGPRWFPDPNMVNFQLRAASNLDTIFLVSCADLTDECLSPLRYLAQLKSLTLKGGYKLTCQTLINLKGLDYLTYLNLSGALSLQTAPLQDYKSLSVLDLSSCSSLVSLSFSAALPLRRLDLQGCPRLTDGSLSSLQLVKGLQHLNVSGSGISNMTLANLQATNMQILIISCCARISNAGLTVISEMHNLCVLDLSEVPVSDFGMAKLAELPLLQKLTLLQCHRITRAGLLWMLQNSQSPVMRASIASTTAPP